MKKSKSERIYPYFLGFLFERITKFVDSRKSKANIYISSRNNKLTNEEIIKYIKSEKSNNNVNTKSIKSIKFVPNANMILLQLADICCSSLYGALSKNDIESWYFVIKLKNKIYCKNGNILGYGFKVFPSINILEYMNILKLK